MAKLTFTEIDTHPAGAFMARILEVKSDKKDFGPVFKIDLATDEGTVEAMCSQTYTDKSKLTKLVRAVLGDTPEDLDTDDLIGKSVGIVVEHKEGSEGGVYARVVSFHKAPKKGKKAEKDPFAEGE